MSPTGDLILCPVEKLLDTDFDEAFIEWGGIWLFIIGEFIFDDDGGGGCGNEDGGNGGGFGWVFIFG